MTAMISFFRASVGNFFDDIWSSVVVESNLRRKEHFTQSGWIDFLELRQCRSGYKMIDLEGRYTARRIILSETPSLENHPA